MLYVACLIISHMIVKFVQFVADESGTTAIEYALIAAGISIVIIASVNGIGTAMNTKFTSVGTLLH
jgi:pilus assembly protein Flp/PilA